MNSRTPSRFISSSPSRPLLGASPYSRKLFDQLFFGDDDGANNTGGGSGSNSDNSNQSDKSDKQSVKKAVKAAMAEILGKTDDNPIEALEMLIRRNHTLEQRAETAERERDEFKSRVPSQSATKKLESYEALGTVEEVKTAITERDDFKTRLETAESENAKTKRSVTLRDVSGDMSWKPSVLTRLDTLTPGLEYFQKSVEKDGQKSEVWHVRYKDGEGDDAQTKELPLEEFAQSRDEWKDFLPALQAEPQEEKPQGARHVRQGSGGANAKGSKFDQVRKDNEAKAEENNKQQPASLESVMNLGTNKPALP